MAQGSVTLQELLDRTGGDLIHHLQLLKTAAEQQVIEDRALARQVAEYLLPAVIDDIASRDPRTLERMTTADFLRLIQSSLAPVRMQFDIADATQADLGALLQHCQQERDQARAELEEARRQIDTLRSQPASRQSPASADSPPAAPASGRRSRSPGGSSSAAKAVPGPVQLTLEVDAGLENLLPRVAGGEHRWPVLEQADAAALERAISQGLLSQVNVNLPSMTFLVGLAPAGRSWLAARGFEAPADSLLGTLEARGLSPDAIYATLWASAALGAIDPNPPFIGDCQPAFASEGQPVLVADARSVPAAAQLVAVLGATGGQLHLLAVDKRSQSAVITQAHLARDEYLAGGGQAVHIALTNTHSLVNGARHADGGIWVWQASYPRQEAKAS